MLAIDHRASSGTSDLPTGSYIIIRPRGRAPIIKTEPDPIATARLAGWTFVVLSGMALAATGITMGMWQPGGDVANLMQVAAAANFVWWQAERHRIGATQRYRRQRRMIAGSAGRLQNLEREMVAHRAIVSRLTRFIARESSSPSIDPSTVALLKQLDQELRRTNGEPSTEL